MEQDSDILSPNLDQILYWNRQATSHIGAPSNTTNGGLGRTHEGDYENGIMGGGSLSSDDSGDYADSDDD
ncbi:Hypothetical predicted protein, partial [Olea europaea subsp. europaea]